MEDTSKGLCASPDSSLRVQILMPTTIRSRLGRTPKSTTPRRCKSTAIDVVPASANAGVGLVHPPVGTNRLTRPASRVLEERQEALHPAVDGALIDEDAAFGQPFTDFGVTKAVPRGPIFRHDHRATPRAPHRHILLCSAYPPHSAAIEPRRVLTDECLRSQDRVVEDLYIRLDLLQSVTEQLPGVTPLA
jgi:hypothetical protein